MPSATSNATLGLRMFESVIVTRFLWALLAILVYTAVSLSAEYMGLLSSENPTSVRLSSVRGSNSKHNSNDAIKIIDCNGQNVKESFDCLEHSFLQKQSGGDQRPDSGYFEDVHVSLSEDEGPEEDGNMDRTEQSTEESSTESNEQSHTTTTTASTDIPVGELAVDNETQNEATSAEGNSNASSGQDEYGEKSFTDEVPIDKSSEDDKNSPDDQLGEVETGEDGVDVGSELVEKDVPVELGEDTRISEDLSSKEDESTDDQLVVSGDGERYIDDKSEDRTDSVNGKDETIGAAKSNLEIDSESLADVSSGTDESGAVDEERFGEKSQDGTESADRNDETLESVTSDLEIDGESQVDRSITTGEGEAENGAGASEEKIVDEVEQQTVSVFGNNENSVDTVGTNANDEAPTAKEQTMRDVGFKQITPRKGRWVPVTEEEKSQVEDISECTHQFHHCCVGQCRQLEFVHKYTPLLYKKWSEPLPSLLDLFRYMDSKDMPCHLSFVGDSLSHDHAVAGMCELSRALGDEYDLSSCRPSSGEGSPWGEFLNSCPEDRHNFTHYEFTRRNDSSTSVGLSCDSIMTTFVPFKLPNLDRVNEGTNRTGGVMVWNWGVHCHNKTDGCLEDKVDEVMLPTLKNQSFANWNMIWSEHEPQHFSTVGGTWEGDREGRTQSQAFECRPASNPDNWRNIGMSQLFRDRNLTMPVVPLFDALLGLYNWHMTGRDCTHYCYTPWRFQLSWDGILRVLRSMLGDADMDDPSATSVRL